MDDTKDEKVVDRNSETPPESTIEKGQLINASGHVQEVNRNFNLLSLAGVGIVVGNVWPAIGYVFKDPNWPQLTSPLEAPFSSPYSMVALPESSMNTSQSASSTG